MKMLWKSLVQSLIPGHHPLKLVAEVRGALSGPAFSIAFWIAAVAAVFCLLLSCKPPVSHTHTHPKLGHLAGRRNTLKSAQREREMEPLGPLQTVLGTEGQHGEEVSQSRPCGCVWCRSCLRTIPVERSAPFHPGCSGQCTCFSSSPICIFTKRPSLFKREWLAQVSQ